MMFVSVTSELHIFNKCSQLNKTYLRISSHCPNDLPVWLVHHS